MVVASQCNELIAQETDTIYAVQVGTMDYRHENSIQAYQNSENWTLWSFPMRNMLDTTAEQQMETMNYSYQNLNDQNLTTAWKTDTTGGDSLQRIEFEFHYGEYEKYGSAYQFFGQVNLFNGWCESEDSWENNARVKTIRVSYNDTAVCVVKLLDTWHFQYFNLDAFFKNRYSGKHLEASWEIKEGDRLTFDILELYPGKKYKSAALSEFMIEGAKN